jgi:glycerol-3-phosphate dehydrogenase
LHYGGDWQTLARRLETQGAEQLHPSYPYTLAEIGWWVEETQAATVEDILRRRLPLELANLKASHGAAPAVARELGRIYNWQPMDVDWNAASYQMHTERVAETAGLPTFS